MKISNALKNCQLSSSVRKGTEALSAYEYKSKVLCTKVPNQFLQTFRKMKLKIFNVKSKILYTR